MTLSKDALAEFNAHLDRGWDLVSRGDYAGALVSARKSIELDGESPEAHNLLGYVLAAEGQSEEALDHYKQAVELDEGFMEAMLNAAEVMISVRDFDGALEMVEEALYLAETDDETADAMLLKFDVLMGKNDREGAKALVAGLPQGPYESPHLDFFVGRAQFETGDAKNAERTLRRALARDGDNPDSHYYLGLALEKQGDARAATISFLEARDRDLRMDSPAWTLESRQFERQVQAALSALPPALRGPLDGALIVVSDAPGAEVVAEGVDPRSEVLLDDLSAKDAPPKVGRVFVYQRNVERAARSVQQVEEVVGAALANELRALYPSLELATTAVG